MSNSTMVDFVGMMIPATTARENYPAEHRKGGVEHGRPITMGIFGAAVPWT
jgi:hypothetical protein